MTENHYIFAEAAEQREYERLRLLEKAFDPATKKRLVQTGIQPGWQCLEVGAGAGSISRWLCEQVGDKGLVVAADIVPRFVGDLPANAEVLEADICNAVLGTERFDLFHFAYMNEHIAGVD